MIPKKSSEIIKVTAEELNCSESKVDAIVTFYYKNLRKELSSLPELIINVPALGYFQLKIARVKSKIKKIEEELGEFKVSSFKDHTRKSQLEDKLKLLKNASDKADEFLAKKKQVRNEQAKYYLEKQKTDNGGN
jgi:vacuolar-type H+-ATPase subunit I/STV1